jgi:glycosyltransferase involved in cell wall biosynthesis
MSRIKRHCLIISYAFPPSSSPGAVRVSRLTKRLNDPVWQMHVLTVNQAFGARSTGITSASPEEKNQVFRVDDPLAKIANGKPLVDAGKKTKKSFLKTIAQILLFPDRTILWAIRLRTASAWVKSVAPDVILSTSPSLSAHLAAMSFARTTNAKWIAEFRDPVSWLPRDNPTTKFKRWLLSALEKFIVSRADATVVVSDTFADYFREKYPLRPIYSIPNGAEFDQTILERNVEDRRARNLTAADRPLVIVHAGELYGGERNPAPLVEAALRAQAKTKRPIRLRFIGSDSYLAAEVATAMGNPSIVEAVASMPHDEAVIETLRADAVVALLHDDPVARVSIMSKYFDYIATANPILVVGSRDATLSLIVENEKVGSVYEYGDIDGMAHWMESLANSPQSHDYDCVEVCRRWSADRMARSMRNVLDSLVS